MRKLVTAVAIGILIGQMFPLGMIHAVQSMLTTSVTFAIRDNKTKRVLIGDYKVVATRVGSRFWRVEASGKTDANGYIRTQASANLPPAIVQVLEPFFR